MHQAEWWRREGGRWTKTIYDMEISCYPKNGIGQSSSKFATAFRRQCGWEFIRWLCQKHIGRYGPEPVVSQTHKSPSSGRGSCLGPGPSPSQRTVKSSSCSSAEIGGPLEEGLARQALPKLLINCEQRELSRNTKTNKTSTKFSFWKYRCYMNKYNQSTDLWKNLKKKSKFKHQGNPIFTFSPTSLRRGRGSSKI